MTTSIAGVLSVLYIVYIYRTRKDFFYRLLLFCIFIELFVEVGYVFKINNWPFPISRFVEDVLGAYCFFKINLCEKSLKNRWINLCFVYTFPILLLLIFPSDIYVANAMVSWDAIILDGENPQYPRINAGVITMTIRFILYASIIIQIIKSFSFEDIRQILMKLNKFCLFFLYLGVFEFVFKNFLGGNELWGGFIDSFFGATGDTVLSGRQKSTTYE